MPRPPKAPTAASLKKVTPENLTGLGVERLAAILAETAAARPELKRRLRMELAAAQGSDHLAVEIDRRLATLESSRSKVSWRKRASFVADLDVLRGLISERLAALDPPGALERLWLFMDLARRLGVRVRDRDGALGEVFMRAAGDIGGLLAQAGDARQASALVEALVRSPSSWADWLPAVLDHVPPAFTAAALTLAQARADLPPGAVALVRVLADRAGDIDAFRSTFTPQALATQPIAAEVARRLLAADRVEEAGRVLQAARPPAARPRAWPVGKPAPVPPDYDWEGVTIDYLERSGDAEAAQAARWASFERTLSAERARDFTRRLKDFDDVEAEARAFAHAAAHPDLTRAVAFLVDWPAPAEAARLIQARSDELDVPDDLAEAWAAKLRVRHPAAAALLLRKAAASAFRRRDFKTCDRLTAAADEIDG